MDNSFLTTDAAGASALLHISQPTMWRWEQAGHLRYVLYGRSKLYPLAEIARLLGISEDDALRRAEAYRVGLWRCWDGV